MSLPTLVAHRGHALRFPENTHASVAAALAAGAARVEVDVQLSAERTPFLFHDADTARACGRAGRFGELSDAEIGTLRVREPGRLGERFPDEPVCSLARLAGLLSAFPAARAFVEVKPDPVERFGAQAVLGAVLDALGSALDRCDLISFSVPFLAAARAARTGDLGLILERWSDLDSTQARALGCEYTFCNVDKIPPEADLAGHPTRFVLYEVVDAALALDLYRRGAEFIETFAWPELTAALTERGDER
ncbi:MAG: glycerophosphodiester phosphodiesterase family protein [Planctomycetota bacterium]|nr:glycerophosphodiester phosphodiesterase family protein [Planctomycetota bacterium]MDP6988148.1 glycerophosphodiester phosphodiesterase family protein [Planctomycetota bacterium]